MEAGFSDFSSFVEGSESVQLSLGDGFDTESVLPAVSCEPSVMVISWGVHDDDGDARLCCWHKCGRCCNWGNDGDADLVNILGRVCCEFLGDGSGDAALHPA